VLGQAKPGPLAGDEVVALSLVRPEARHPLGPEPANAGQHLVDPQVEAAPGDPRMGPQ
jgi:hypothetical protein